jgi:choline dehydrogenase-like flavoprotein
MATHESQVFDIIVVGGGTAGCVVATRLQQRKPTLSILVLEAGEDLSKNPDVYSPQAGALLLGSDADWKYSSVPQANLNGRSIYYQAGKGLSGSAAVNTGRRKFSLAVSTLLT